MTIAVKGLLGKCGCTRMVQGGYNVALAEGDSVERHFMDTIEGGKWLPDQDLAWTLVTGAVERIRELENELGCFFDRNADGTIHQKAFAGQTFDRTVHKGDLTGIEIMNRLSEQVWARGIHRLEEHRALDFVAARNETEGALKGAPAGVLLVDIRTGEYVFVQAKAVLLATGGGPTMYRFHTPSGDKSCDGLAMALRFGLPLRDMEMVQFHPTGLLAGPDTRMTGTVLEEGLRGAGGYLLDGGGNAIHGTVRPARRARDARHRVARDPRRDARRTNDAPRRRLPQHGPPGARQRAAAIQGHGRALRGLRLRSRGRQGRSRAHRALHDGRRRVRSGLHDRTARDSSWPARTRAACTAPTGWAATVWPIRRCSAASPATRSPRGSPASASGASPIAAALESARARAEAPFSGRHADPGALESMRERLYGLMWDDAGIVRDRASLARAATGLGELDAELGAIGIADGARAFNLTWHDALNLANLIAVSRVIVAAATARENSRGAHYRSDFPDEGELAASTFVRVRQRDGKLATEAVPVRFTRVAPGGTLGAR